MAHHLPAAYSRKSRDTRTKTTARDAPQRSSSVELQACKDRGSVGPQVIAGQPTKLGTGDEELGTEVEGMCEETKAVRCSTVAQCGLSGAATFLRMKVRRGSFFIVIREVGERGGSVFFLNHATLRVATGCYPSGSSRDAGNVSNRLFQADRVWHDRVSKTLVQFPPLHIAH